MTPLCIIPCGSKKIWDTQSAAGPTPARHVYIGPLATLCRRYAERFYPASWCILSAKYGFLFPDDIVPGPYNVRFGKRKTNPISPECLAAQAKEKGLHEYPDIVALGGKHYVQAVTQALAGSNIWPPLKGCDLFSMQHKLKAAITNGTPL